MRIAVISDSHDNIWKLRKALPYLAAADLTLHCGDIISAFMVIALIKGTEGKPVHMVWGNNDGDKAFLAEVASKSDHIHLHGDYAFLNQNGVSIAVNHYPKVARGLAQSGTYDLVCYGHDHTANAEWVGNTMLLNPGELMGMSNRPTLAVFNTKSKTVEFIEV